MDANVGTLAKHADVGAMAFHTRVGTLAAASENASTTFTISFNGCAILGNTNDPAASLAASKHGNTVVAEPLNPGMTNASTDYTCPASATITIHCDAAGTIGVSNSRYILDCRVTFKWF
jgi:hypothetical protein